MTPHAIAALVVGLLMAFSIPGPCSYDAHTELDCADGQRCPDGLACAPDGHCKAEDVACDDLDEDQFPGGGIACDGVCVARDALQTDEDNCGACGTVCDAGLGCCNGACVAVDVDERCGDCGVVCLADQTCFEGACAAACIDDDDCAGAGDVCCDGLCSDGSLDERCGACDVACDPAASETCVEQVCRTSCTNDNECPGARCCDGLCVLAGDPEHCGACNESCGADTVCLDDTCAPECADDRPCAGADAGLACCGGRCVDTSDDDDHCGACDAPCAATSFCNDSTCRTGDDRDCCGSSCRDCDEQACVNNQCVTCDVYEQDCGADASCVPGFPNLPPAGACVASSDTGAARFDTCTGSATNTGCQEELSCQGVNGAQTCVRFCDFNAGNAGCEAGETCANLEFAPGLFIGVCVPPCDITTSFTCAWGTLAGTCIPSPSGCASGGCVIAGTLPVGSVCSPGECAAGLVCDGTCVAMCRDVDTSCAGGTCSDAFFCDEVGVCR
jgi:hypothetical protein